MTGAQYKPTSKRLHILDLGFIMYKRLTISLSFELWKCVIVTKNSEEAYIIMLEIPMMNTWH